MAHSRLLVFGAVLLAMAAGCPFSFTNDDHCAAQAGDATCAAANAATPYCALDGCGLYDEADNISGCVAELPTDLSCYSPCGGKQDANAQSDCDAPATEATSVSSSSDTDTLTSGSASTDASGTETDSCACEGDTPICVDGECVACVDDDACAQAGLPSICDDGRCVECQPMQADIAAEDESIDGRQSYHQGCSISAPNCNTGACVGQCLFHDDCPGSGCDFSTGLCGPLDTRFYVDETAGADDPEASGSQGAPFATVGFAVERVAEASGMGTAIVTVVVSEGNYLGPIETGARTVIVIADPDGDRPQFSAPDETADADPVFVVDADNAVLSLGSVRVANSELVVRVASTGQFFGDGVEMVDNNSAVRLEGAAGFVRNSLVTGSSEPPFVLAPNGELGVITTTIVENAATILFECEDPKEFNRISLAYSIAGQFDPLPKGWSVLSPSCAFAPGYPVIEDNAVEVVPGEDSFATGTLFRLDTNASEAYRADERPEACAEGTPTVDEGFLLPCPPDRDVDGVLRPDAYWRGFSANP
ncbi:MAG: hypothetical protein ACRBN8_05130 [Nannocystales bacterium]